MIKHRWQFLGSWLAKKCPIARCLWGLLRIMWLSGVTFRTHLGSKNTGRLGRSHPWCCFSGSETILTLAHTWDDFLSSQIKAAWKQREQSICLQVCSVTDCIHTQKRAAVFTSTESTLPILINSWPIDHPVNTLTVPCALWEMNESMQL